MTVSLSSPPLHVANLHSRVTSTLSAFVDDQRATLARISPQLAPVADTLRAFLLGGGKRLRPAFCYWGWRGAGGADCAQIVTAATSLELLQACALIHDDYIDGSDTRRGQPAVHRRFEALHQAAGWQGSAAGFGAAAAILLGDLCLSYSDELFNRCGLPAERVLAARPLVDLMRAEVMAGQYLDVVEQAVGGGSVERAEQVIRFKAAGYTVQRPLQIGAALAGADQRQLAAYSAYGLPLGEAFQLRDDLLGVFGDPEETGKPAGDDLREGKRTVLIAMALERADAGQRDLLRRLLGDPLLDDAGVAGLRTTILATGAVRRVEALIERRTRQALDALAEAPIAEQARLVLAELAVAATTRRL